MAVKVCPNCGLENRASATVCGSCREMMLGVVAMDPAVPAPAKVVAAAVGSSPDAEPAAAPVMHLEGPAGSGFLARVAGQAVLGREADVDLTRLDPDAFVSRRHARIVHRAGRWWVEHLSETNPTTVGGVRLTRGRAVVLEDGDRLSLAKIELLVRIRP